MTQGLRNLQTAMQAAETVLSQGESQSAQTWSSAQVFKFKSREDSNGRATGKLPIWQVMQQLSREIGQSNNNNNKRQDETAPSERWRLQSEGLSGQVASLRAQLSESRRAQDRLRESLYESLKREAGLKAKLAAAEDRISVAERWSRAIGQGMEEEVSRSFAESDKKRLQDLTECLALAVKSMALFVGLMDRDNQGALRYTFVHNQKPLFGEADIIGKRNDEVLDASIPGVRELMAVERQALETGATATGEITLVSPGSCTHWMVTCEPRRGQSSEVMGVAVAALNITETVEGRARLAKLHTEIAARDATEAELRKAVQMTEEAIKTKSMFLAIMSHEMRTPLNGVLGMAHVLNTTPLDDEQRELVEAMLASGDTLLAIVDDAVDVRKLESGEVSQHSQPFNPHQMVNQILHMASAAERGSSIRFEADISDSVPREIFGDELRIRQVLTNLVHNALKFTDSGFVRINISVSDDPPLEPSPQDSGRIRTLSNALSGVDSGCISGLTIAGGEGPSSSDNLDDAATSRPQENDGRQSPGTQGFRGWQVAQSAAVEDPSACTPQSVLDNGLQDMDDSRIRSNLTASSSAAVSSESSLTKEERSAGERQPLDESASGPSIPDSGEVGSLQRRISRQRSLDAAVTWEQFSPAKSSERSGRGLERLQRQNSRSTSAEKKRNSSFQKQEAPPRRQGTLQRQNSLASISEGIFNFDEAVGRIEQGLERIKGAKLSRENSLDSNSGGSPRIERASSSLQRQGSMMYVTEGFQVSPRVQGLGRSVSACPQQSEGFGALDVRKTASEHAISRCASFEESGVVWLRIAVQDSGCGIPEEAFPMLFEKFTQVDASTTRQYGGTGLGLAICKQLVENILRGKMEVESKLDEGSTFTFTVPCRVSPSTSARLEETSEQQGESGETAAPHAKLPPADDMAWTSEKARILDALERIPSKERKLQSLEVPDFKPEEEDAKHSPSPEKTAPKVSPKLGQSPPDKTRKMQKPASVAAPLSPNPPKLPPPAPPPADSPPSLLLVEDNNINVVVAQSMLKRLGLKADVARNGVEAVQALCRKTYHLVMMDICMPRMDGLQATSAVRRFEESGNWRFEVEGEDLQELESCKSERRSGCQQGIHVPIIAMTANAMEMDVTRCYSHGLDAFIAKPVSFDKLRSVLGHFLPWYKVEVKGAKR